MNNGSKRHIRKDEGIQGRGIGKGGNPKILTGIIVIKSKLS